MVVCFFLSIIERINRNYHNLLNEKSGTSTEDSSFLQRWGWVHSTKQVADFQNIKVAEAYDLGIVEYLNTLAYLKDFNKDKEQRYKKWELQQRLK
jgi:hypothetical protein